MRVYPVNVDTIFWISGITLEAAVICVLLYRRIGKLFPYFLAYSIWSEIGSIGAYTLFWKRPGTYVTAYLAVTIIDAVLLFCVLIELGLTILRPLRSSLPRSTPLILACIILIVGGVIWPFVSFPGASHFPLIAREVARLEQDLSVLRILAFLALAACSQLLSIGWRDRELQIATGLGFYSLVSVVVTVLHSYQTTGIQYAHLNRVGVASYFCSMIYWIVSFSQKEVERREMTPEMRSFLLALAGAARTTRTALASSSSRPKNK